MLIALGSDHAGFRLKELLKDHLGKQHSVTDLGAFTEDPSDYPDAALAVAGAVTGGRCERGIVVCGTGIGVCMVANKVPGIRAALCRSPHEARLSREHNDANVLALGAWITAPELAMEIVEEWIRTPFQGGRHARRLEKIAEVERIYKGDPSRQPEASPEAVFCEVKSACQGLVSVSGLMPGQLVVLGCSTSEIIGRPIGSATNLEVGRAVVSACLEATRARGLGLAVQCCEHLNRALVVEKDVAERYGLEEVRVIPVPEAGGAAAAAAMELMNKPVVVEKVSAHAGLDIGDTFIGMHLRPVVVPVRLRIRCIGSANLTMARSRPKLIGGERARYPELQGERTKVFC